MVMTAGGIAPSAGMAEAGGTRSSYLAAADTREARAPALSSRGAGGRTAGYAAPTSSQLTFSAESLDSHPLPVFKQSVSSTLTRPGSGSFLMNDNGSYNDSYAGGAAGVTTKGKGTGARGTLVGAGGGAAAAASKDEKGKRARGGERGDPKNTGARGKATTSLGSSTKGRSAGTTKAAGTSSQEGDAGGRVSAATAARGGEDCGGTVGGAAVAGAAELAGGTRAATTARGGWTALFRGSSPEDRIGETPERCLLMHGTSGAARQAAAAAARADEGVPTAAALTVVRGGRGGGGRSAAAPRAEQQGLVRRREKTEEKAKYWMAAGVLVYFVLGILVLYCVSYANIEWCCIFVIFGVTVGGLGLAGLRQSSRLLLLIHVGAAAVLLFTLFVAWCYNIHVLLRAIEILLASAWPPLHHQQFKYYYSIPTAYESPPAPWVEEVLLMRLQYPSEGNSGIRKLLGDQQQQDGSNSSSKRGGKKAASSALGTGSKDGHTAGAKAPAAGAAEDDHRKATTAAEGGTGTAAGTEPERRPGNAADTAATQLEGRKAAAAATPTARSKGSAVAGRRLQSAEAAETAAAEQRGEAAPVSAAGWRQTTHLHNIGAETSALEARGTFLKEGAAAGGRRVGGEKRTGAGSAVAEEVKQRERSGGLSRRLQGGTAAGAPVVHRALTPPQRDAPGERETSRRTPRPLASPQKGKGSRMSRALDEGRERKTEDDAERRRGAAFERASAGAPLDREATGTYTAAGPPVHLAAAHPAAAATVASAHPGPAATGAASPHAAEHASSTGQQLRGSGPVQQQLQEEDEEQEGEDDMEDEGQQGAVSGAPPSDSSGYDRSPDETSLSSVFSLAAEQAAAAAGEQLEQRIFIERDETARALIRGCVDGAEKNTNFLNDAAHAMSSLAARGWLCAFSRAEIAPFHRWPVDCSTECGYAFLDAGHDLHASDYYDMTRVAEYLIQVSSLPPKRMQQCVDYAASTICSIKNRSFFVVWVVMLLLWLLLACTACCTILPLSLYNTLQVIKGMQQR